MAWNYEGKDRMWYYNIIQDLVEVSKMIKAIPYKQVYKRKKWVNGKIKTYKARLIAKGYSPKPNFVYKKTFSPIIMLKSIRILLSIAVHLGYKISQMDVKVMSFNADLKEHIYIIQPDGFIAKGCEHLICKLHKPIYQFME